jgi:hypothetical protein
VYIITVGLPHLSSVEIETSARCNRRYTYANCFLKQWILEDTITIDVDSYLYGVEVIMSVSYRVRPTDHDKLRLVYRIYMVGFFVLFLALCAAPENVS